MIWTDLVLNNPQIEIQTVYDQPDVPSSLNQKQKLSSFQETCQ
jgi:hypothetical protein